MEKQQRNQALVLLAAALLALFWTAASQRAEYAIQITGALDTVSEIKISTAKNGNVILEQCKAYIETMDNQFSTYKKDSDISALNAAAGSSETVTVSADTAQVLAYAKEYAVESNGFFDVTVGALVELWDKAGEEKILPTPEAISQAIHTVDYTGLQVDTNTNQAKLEKAGQKVNLGGIAKGYITDGLVAMLRAESVGNALINLGGNTYAMGKKTEFSRWKVGIQDPNNPDLLLGAVAVEDRCVITSGDYQRYFEIDGQKYHHILNPNTGSPSKSGLKSVTILAKDATLADALSTACFVLGYSEGANLIKEYDDVQAIFVTDSNTVYYSKELEDSFTRDNLSYEYKAI